MDIRREWVRPERERDGKGKEGDTTKRDRSRAIKTTKEREGMGRRVKDADGG
jgi:hypothetical protein